jgi:general secretion pathway protein K
MSAPLTAARRIMTARRTSSDGFIIVAVLWILGALAALVSIYAVYVMDTASAFSMHEDRLQSEALVTAALELAAYQLTATPISSRPTHGAFDFRLGKANIAVSFQSEAARIDLNAAPKELLAGLFVSLDADPDSAAHYADRVVHWRSRPLKNQGTSATAPAAEKASPEARFFHVNELSAVPGLPMDWIERVLPFVTIYSGRPQVNILDAAPEVVAALPGMTQEHLKAVLAQRQTSGDSQALLQLLGPAQSYATTDGSQASCVTIWIAYDNGRRAASKVIILPFDDGNEPYSVLSWRDELEPDDGSGPASL